MNYTRAVIHESNDQAFVEDLAGTDGWDLADLTPRRPGEVFQQTGRTNKGKTRIEYVVDPTLGLRFVVVAGADQATFIRKIRKAGPLYTRPAVHRRIKAAKTPVDRARALMIAGVAAPADGDPQMLDDFQQAFADEAIQVRRAAVIARVYTGWPALQQRVQHIADSDRADDLRQLAHQALARWTARSWHDPLG